MEKKTGKSSSKNVVIGAAIGVLAGAIAGILFAPKSGKETRADIAKYAHEMKDKIAEELSKAGNVTKETYNKIVAKVVKVYELEKKITSEDAKDIKEKFDSNFDEIKKAIKS